MKKINQISTLEWLPLRGRGQILVVFRAGSLSPELIVRRKHGARYISIVHLCGMPLFNYFVFTIAIPFVGVYGYGKIHYEHVTWYSAILFIIGFINMIIAMNGTDDKGEAIHSRYSGFPMTINPFRNKNEYFVKVFVEPLNILLGAGLFIIIGKHLWAPAFTIGILWGASGIALFFKEIIATYLARNTFLDIVDDQIEKQQIENVLNGVGATDHLETRGFHFPGRKPKDPEARKSIADMYRGLSPELKKLIEDKEQAIDKNKHQEIDKENVKEINQELTKNSDREIDNEEYENIEND